jgi:dCMP deaminase
MAVRPAWDTYFLNIARTVATRADCTRRQVGAVIVKDHRIVSTGYNGAPAGLPGCLTAGACPRGHSDVVPGSSYDTGPGSCIAVHAEQNAILYADYDRCKGAILYCTDVPCDGCARLIKAAGIGSVVTP